jgi:aspartyl-tRNA(Asn)/glutamyl-tRNA(Gln) amidotransferase subunit A
MTNPILALSAQELSGLIKNKEISPVELTTACLQEIERTNHKTSIYITIASEHALAQAHNAETEILNGHYRGPLHGIPFACKDLYATKDIRTTGGSRVLEDFIPTYDAHIIQSLYQSGSVLLGKTNMHEFAYGATGENPHFGTVSNPYDHTRNAGGSSSGSAATVASNTAVFALGTDTGGSVRAPSALCGVVGLKPTYGRVNLQGVIPYCWSLDHFGVSTKSVYDAALIMDCVSKNKQGTFVNSLEGQIEGLKIGIPRNFFYEDCEKSVLDNTTKIIDSLTALGCEFIDIETPKLDYSRTVSLLIQLPEVLSYHSRYFKEKRDLYGIDMMAGMAVGQFILAEHYIRAKRIVELYKEQIENIFNDVDLLLTPACPITAPLLDQVNITTSRRTEAKGNAITRFTSFFNLTGNPSISIPSGTNDSGLPTGVQVVGRHFDETLVLNAANIIEQGVKTLNT